MAVMSYAEAGELWEAEHDEDVYDLYCGATAERFAFEGVVAAEGHFVHAVGIRKLSEAKAKRLAIRVGFRRIEELEKNEDDRNF